MMKADKKSKVESMTPAEIGKFIGAYKRISTGDYHCEHKHFGCSTYDDGPCFDEALAARPDLM